MRIQLYPLTAVASLSPSPCLSLYLFLFFTSCPPSYPKCSGAKSPGLAADMHFKDDVIAFIGPACAFALEPVARLASYWNTPVITGMGDQVRGLSTCVML